MDFVVTVKQGNEVKGHFFIEAGGTGSLKVDAGEYDVFFSAGKGWHIEKPSPIGACDQLGWFEEDFGVTQTSISLTEGGFWSCLLEPTPNGNMRTLPSDHFHAF